MLRLLVANKRLYVLCGRWLGIIDMTFGNIVVITDWLKILPKNFSKTTAVIVNK